MQTFYQLSKRKATIFQILKWYYRKPIILFCKSLYNSTNMCISSSYENLEIGLYWMAIDQVIIPKRNCIEEVIKRLLMY